MRAKAAALTRDWSFLQRSLEASDFEDEILKRVKVGFPTVCTVGQALDKLHPI